MALTKIPDDINTLYTTGAMFDAMRCANCHGSIDLIWKHTPWTEEELHGSLKGTPGKECRCGKTHKIIPGTASGEDITAICGYCSFGFLRKKTNV